MASSGREPATGRPGLPGLEGCSSSPQPETRARSQNPIQVSDLATGHAVSENLGSSLPKNVVSERERRKRISKSCERLRALLPHFDGRREDMASVLEMVVQFLQLAHTLTPEGKQLSMNYAQVSAPSQEPCCVQQGDDLQLTEASQLADNKPDPETETSTITLLKDPSLCEMLDMNQSEALEKVSELQERPLSSPGQDPGVSHEDQTVSSSAETSSLEPGSPSWLPQSRQSASPEMNEVDAGGLYEAALLFREDTSLCRLVEEDASLGRLAEEDPFLGTLAEEDPFLGRLAEEDPLLDRLDEEDPFLGRLDEEDPFLGRLAEEDPLLGRLDEEDPFLGRLDEEDPFLGRLDKEDPFLGRLAEEANMRQTPVPDIRYISGSMGFDVENDLSFLLTTSHDWWVGPFADSVLGPDPFGDAELLDLVEDRGSPLLCSSPVNWIEPGFLLDPEPSSPEKPCGLDLGSWDLTSKEEDNSMFSDLLTYWFY